MLAFTGISARRNKDRKIRVYNVSDYGLNCAQILHEMHEVQAALDDIQRTQKNNVLAMGLFGAAVNDATTSNEEKEAYKRMKFLQKLFTDKKCRISSSKKDMEGD